MTNSVLHGILPRSEKPIELLLDSKAEHHIGVHDGDLPHTEVLVDEDTKDNLVVMALRHVNFIPNQAQLGIATVECAKIEAEDLKTALPHFLERQGIARVTLVKQDTNMSQDMIEDIGFAESGSSWVFERAA